MGMDIYFQSVGKDNAPIGERQNLRCLELYQLLNSWCLKNEHATPESGEQIRIDASAWELLSPEVVATVAASDQKATGCSEQEALTNAQEWVNKLWSQKSFEVLYWFTN